MIEIIFYIKRTPAKSANFALPKTNQRCPRKMIRKLLVF